MGASRTVTLPFAALFAASRVLPISDPDYHWHLHTGRTIARTRSVPSVDPFSHTFFGAKWSFVDWLSDLAMYGVQRLAGDTAVVALFAIVGALALHFAFARGRGENRAPTVAALLLVAAAAWYRVTPRPQTFTPLLLALLLLLLDRARAGERRAFVLVPVLVAVWQNVHSSGLVALLVVAAWTASAALERRDAKRFAMMLVASTAALFCCVRPLDRLLAGFAHLGDPRVARLFAEWGPVWSPGAFGAQVIALMLLIALAVAGCARTRDELGVGAFVAAIGLSLMAVFSSRFVPLAAIALAVPALHGIVRIARDTRWACVAIACTAPLLAIQLRRPETGLARGFFPERAAAFLRDQHLEGKLFNDFDFGGYLLWTLGEARWPVFVDGRSMAVYGVDFVERAALSTGPSFEALLAQYDPAIIVTAPDARAGSLSRDPRWLLVFFDDTAAVFVRARDASPAAQRLVYRAVKPTRWFELIGDPSQRAIATDEVERAVREAPDSSLAAVTRIAVVLANGDLPRADALIADATSRFPGVQRVARAALLRCEIANDKACVCTHARDIGERFPKNSYSRDVLTRWQCP